MSDTERNADYDDFLNEIYGPVKLGSFEFSAADIFYALDETAYRCGLADWEDEYATEDEENDTDDENV